MTIWLRILRTTWQNISRNAAASVAAVLVISLLTALANALIFANFTRDAAISAVESQLDLPISFAGETDSFQASNLAAELQEEFPGITEIRFISADDAFTGFLGSFREENETLADWLIDNTEKSPLPATLIVVAGTDLQTEVIDWLTSSRFAKQLDLETLEQSEIATLSASKIESISRTLGQLSYGLGISSAALTVLIILVVLQLAIISRRNEITIMRLTGATRRFVRLPFLLEGGLFGLLGAVFGTLGFTFLLFQLGGENLTPQIFGSMAELLSSATKNYKNSLPLILGWLSLSGFSIGILGSQIATWRNLQREIKL